MPHDLVMRRLGLLHAYGDTAIFDTIIDGLYAINRGRYDKKALLVVTDGDFQEPKTNVLYVFADGVRFEYPKGSEQQTANKGGTATQPTSGSRTAPARCASEVHQEWQSPERDLEATAQILDKKNDNNQDDREEDRMGNQPPIPSLA